MPDWICLLAQGSTTQANPTGQMVNTFIIFGTVIFVFWLLVLRPQMKKDKDRQELITNIKKNDRVLTTGGILGVVKFVDEKEVHLRVDDDNKVVIRFAKSAIVGVEKSAGEGDTK